MNETKQNIKLTSLVKTSGCAAKLSPAILHDVLGRLPKFYNEHLLVGFDTSDDACVYKINDTTVLIQTVDFFPPMVDDPFLFGQIAAANALSDVYAMGGNPITAMNLLCFPACLDTSVMEEILAGGYDKVKESGAVIAGGHTISDPTPKYGLCVTGLAAPEQILTNAGAKEGDVLVLTKPLGIGILNTTAKAELITEEQQTTLHTVMSTLNKYAKEACKGLSVHACTDITGFGLLGHSYEMAAASKQTLRIDSGSLPLLPGVCDYASMGLLPEGMYNNLAYLEGHYHIDSNLPQPLVDVLFDPQTSGGLLLSMPERDAMEFLSRMELHSSYSRIIGEVIAKENEELIIH